MEHFSMREYFQAYNSHYGGTPLEDAYSKDNTVLANTVRKKKVDANGATVAKNDATVAKGASVAKGDKNDATVAMGASAANVWNYLGLKKTQRDCLFNCSCSGMTCLGNCNNDKCKYKCGCNSIDCLKKCMEPVKPKKVVKKIKEAEEEEEEEEEELRKNNTLENIPLHGSVMNNFARFTPINGDSFSVFVEPGIFSEKSPETLKKNEIRIREIDNYKLKLRD
jgi:hypothetical protein